MYTKLRPFSSITSQKTCPYLLTKINWKVPYWGHLKLKSRSLNFYFIHERNLVLKWLNACSHQITFLVNSMFIKLLHSHSSLFPTICAICERWLCFESHVKGIKRVSILSKNSMNSYPNHGLVPGVEKHTFPAFFVYADGFRSGLPGVIK